MTNRPPRPPGLPQQRPQDDATAPGPQPGQAPSAVPHQPAQHPAQHLNPGSIRPAQQAPGRPADVPQPGHAPQHAAPPHAHSHTHPQGYPPGQPTAGAPAPHVPPLQTPIPPHGAPGSQYTPHQAHAGPGLPSPNLTHGAFGGGGGGRPPHGHDGRPPQGSGFSLVSILLYALFGIFAVVAAVVAFLIVAPPTDLIRSQVIAAVKEHTGRDLKIDGPASISFYPSIGVSMDDVTLGAPPEMGGPPTAKIDNLTVAVKILPLLSSEVQVDTLILTRPSFDLRVDEQGRKSWEFAASRHGKARAHPVRVARAQIAQATTNDGLSPEAREFIQNATDNQPKRNSGGTQVASLEQLRLGDVRIVEGKVRYTDVSNQVEHAADKINLTLALPSISAPLKAKGDLIWKGERVDFDTTLTSLKALLSERPADLDARIASRHVTAAYDGKVTSTQNVSLDGTLVADAKSLRALMGWLGTTLPEADGFGPLSVQGRLNSNGTTHKLTNVEIGLDGAAATGVIAVTTGGARPHVATTLKVSHVDLNKYLPPEEAGAGGAAGGAGKKRQAPSDNRSIDGVLKPQVRGYTRREGWSREPIDLAGLEAADVDANLTVGKLLFKKITVGRSRVTVKLKNRSLRADLTEMQLYRGNGRGLVTLKPNKSNHAVVAASFALANIDVEPLLRDAVEINWLSGTGNLTLAVTGTGKNQDALVRTLAGTTKVDFKNGAVRGLNVPRTIRAISQGNLANLANAPTEKTDFSELTATFAIKNGIATNTDLKMQSPLVRVTGEGRILLPDQAIDYTVKPKLVAELEGQGGGFDVAGLVIPVRIHGPFGQLSYTPDFNAIDPDQAADAIDRIGDRVKNLKGKNAAEIVDGILGGILGDQGGGEAGGNQQDGGADTGGGDGSNGGSGGTGGTGGNIDAKKLLDGLFGN